MNKLYQGLLSISTIAAPPKTMTQVVAHTRKFTTRNMFKDEKELLNYARKFLKNRLESLDKDVKHCLKKPYSPFPAILYCFSTVDLLGALYAGQAEKRRIIKKAGASMKAKQRRPDTTAYSRRYMKRFMNYNSESIYLQQIFRHKTVHLARPKPAIMDKNRIIAWRYYSLQKK